MSIDKDKEYIGYIRVSSHTQNDARQLDGVKLKKVYREAASGKNTDRKELQALLDYIREGDSVAVHELSRIGRNLADINSIIETIINKGASILFVKENLEFKKDSNDMVSKLMLQMLGSFYEFERDIILERQREGIEKAKAAGKYKGGKRRIDTQAVKRLLDEGMSLGKIATHLSISKSSVQRIKNELRDT